MATMEHFDLISHCTEKFSDKVYVVSIQEFGGNWRVIGKWGKNGANLNQQNKGSFSTRESAIKFQTQLFEEKKRKGYVDVRNPSYCGNVSPNSRWLQPFLEVPIPVATMPLPVPSLKPLEDLPEVFEVVCVDNTGCEEFFNLGVEYLAKRSSDKDMIIVYDKFAKEREVFRNRFVIGEES